MKSLLLLFPALGLLRGEFQSPGATVGSDEGPGPSETRTFVLDRGADRPVLFLPRDETLVYRVVLSIAFIQTSVGTVTQTCEVAPYKPSVLLPPEPDAEPDGDREAETATIKIHAEGDYTWYSMDSTIEARHLPQEWPSTTYRQISEGSEKRRRENMLGFRDGEFTASYRRDTSKGAPRGTRIWSAPAFRPVPEGTIDMLTAVFLVRTLIRDDLDTLSFTMLDKRRVWDVKIERGEEKRMETAAGTFDVVELVLIHEPHPGEWVRKEKIERFEGLFGIHGTIHLWVERGTGIPVRIEGDLPIGPLTIGMEVVLTRYEGTPAEFQPVND